MALNGSAENRWPEYMATVRDSGYRSILAVPLELKGLAVAALNIYSDQPETLQTKWDEALRSAALISKVMVVGLRIATYADHLQDRRMAMESRTVIDLAVGIVMGQHRCTQAQAVERLKQVSSKRNIKLRTLSKQLVQSIGGSTIQTQFDSGR